MRALRKRGGFSAAAVNTALLIGLGVIMLYPFWYVLMFSLSTYQDAIGVTFLLWPANFTLLNIR